MKTSLLIKAYQYFNPYHYDGDYCNPWSALLADYRRKRDNPDEVFHCDAFQAGSFAKWLVNEANRSAFEKFYGL